MTFKAADDDLQYLDLQASQQVAKPLYDAKVQPTTLIPKQVGNMYTASLYAALASLVHNNHKTLVNTLPKYKASPLQKFMLSDKDLYFKIFRQVTG